MVFTRVQRYEKAEKKTPYMPATCRGYYPVPKEPFRYRMMRRISSRNFSVCCKSSAL